MRLPRACFVPRLSGFHGLVLLAAWLSCVATSHAQSTTGQWGPLLNLPYRPVTAMILPDGRVLFWSYYLESNVAQIWDPVANTVTPTPSVDYLLFCAGQSMLADGRIFAAGGHIADYVGSPNTSVYNPFSNSWTKGPAMNAGRWYPSTVTLGNGDVAIVTGNISVGSLDNLPQVYRPATNSLRDLTSAQQQMALYPKLFLAPNGKVVRVADEPTTAFLDVNANSGTGQWVNGPKTIYGKYRNYGIAVMYAPGKVLIAGGDKPPTASAEILDLNAATPAWKATNPMHYARRQFNAVVLPDGKVLVTGGTSGGASDDDQTQPVKAAEVWDPATGQWTVLASEQNYRGYHSTSVLLPDGRVISMGGNVGGPNAQIFSPPYLFNGSRPTISSAPTSASYGQTIFIGTPNASSISTVSLIGASNVTHTFNTGQRYIPLTKSQVSGGLNVTIPSSANTAPPGYYLLFLVNGSGVPSVAKILRVGPANSSTGKITGKVTNSGGAALAGVQVSYSSGVTTTDSGGNYTLTGVPATTIQLTASLSGYNKSSKSVTVTAGQTATVNFSLTAASVGAIAGKITNSSGTALAGAGISYNGGSTISDSSGNYKLSNVPAGTVSVTVELGGYSSATKSVSVTQNATTTQNFVLQPAPTGTIKGNVKNTSGTNISGATVSYGGATTTTDSSGNYVFNQVQVGTVLVVVNKSGYPQAQQSVTVTENQTSTANFVLGSTSGSSSLSGLVSNIANNYKIVGATVSYGGGSTVSDGNGNYAFSSIASGTYTVTATANGFLPRSYTVSVNGATTQNIQLAVGGKVAGTVTTSGGAAISGAAVNLKGGLIATNVTYTTDSTGHYLSAWIPAGNYTVTASKSGYVTASKSTSVTGGVTSTVNFALATGTTSSGTVTGRVTNVANGYQIAGASVSYSGGSTTTDANGYYTLNSVPAATTTFTVSATGFLTRTFSVAVASGTTTTANFQLAVAGILAGKVATSAGAGIAGVTVTTTGGYFNETKTFTTDSNGNYSTSWITAGSYTVRTSKSGLTTQSKSATVTGGQTTTVNFTY